jgi:ligand-binding SRPBCC domain-containing protein
VVKFQILEVSPQPVRQGTLINYSLRVHGIPLRWTSEIVEWEPPHRFVDLQLRGPYKLWRHEHRFEARDGGTLISDTIILALPLGVLGQLAYKVKVRSDVQEIFAFREKKSARSLAKFDRKATKNQQLSTNTHRLKVR